MDDTHRTQRILSGRFIAGAALPYTDEHGIVWSLDFSDVKGITRRMVQAEARATADLARLRALEEERDRWVTRWEMVDAARADAEMRAAALVAEVARLTALLDKAAPHICPSCGPHARVDEEGCCAACGDDTHLDVAVAAQGLRAASTDPVLGRHVPQTEAEALRALAERWKHPNCPADGCGCEYDAWGTRLRACAQHAAARTEEES